MSLLSAFRAAIANPRDRSRSPQPRGNRGLSKACSDPKEPRRVVIGDLEASSKAIPSKEPNMKVTLSGAAPTPPVPRRKVAVTALERAGPALQPSGIVGRLPCRDKEQECLRTYLEDGLRCGGSQQVLYMSGMPGTGKTAAFLAAIQEMETNQVAGSRGFVFVHTNAMRLGKPNAIFGEILRHLPGYGRCSASAAQGEVQRFFSERRPSEPVVVLLIDEIDQLVTRSQGVLYNVFDWLSMRAPLVVAAISNTMDLPERMLPRVASRFEIVRVDFWPYTRDQIHTILSERLRIHGATKAFTADALKRCSARVAAGCGDVRKALQLCRRAVEICQAEALEIASKRSVQGAQLDAAAKELLYSNPAAQHIAGLGGRARDFLIGLLLEFRGEKGADAVSLRKVTTRFEELVRSRSGDSSYAEGTEDAAFLATRLEATGLLCQHGMDVQSTRDACKGTTITLGAALDVEDLAMALVNSEVDPAIKERLRK